MSPSGLQQFQMFFVFFRNLSFLDLCWAPTVGAHYVCYVYCVYTAYVKLMYVSVLSLFLKG